MLPAFLLPETEVREAGFGNSFDLGGSRPGFILVTLGITDILEQQSLDMAIQGSADGANWPAKPLIAFSQKFYCGTYQLLMNLEAHPDVRFLRAKWAVNRWGRGDLKPLFGIYLFVEKRQVAVVAKGAA